VPCSEISGLICGTEFRPSLEPEVEAGTIASGGVGASDALTRNPADVRKITADNTKPMEFASPVPAARAAERASIRFLIFKS
jgi:hypothetical protein